VKQARTRKGCVSNAVSFAECLVSNSRFGTEKIYLRSPTCSSYLCGLSTYSKGHWFSTLYVAQYHQN